MKVSNFVIQDAIVPALTATTKEGVIREMVHSLHGAGYFRDTELDDIVRAVMRREQLGTTGIGKHIAIPHSRHPAVDRLIGTLAFSQPGVAFDSLAAYLWVTASADAWVTLRQTSRPRSVALPGSGSTRPASSAYRGTAPRPDRDSPLR